MFNNNEKSWSSSSALWNKKETLYKVDLEAAAQDN